MSAALYILIACRAAFSLASKYPRLVNIHICFCFSSLNCVQGLLSFRCQVIGQQHRWDYPPLHCPLLDLLFSFCALFTLTITLFLSFLLTNLYDYPVVAWDLVWKRAHGSVGTITTCFGAYNNNNYYYYLIKTPKFGEIIDNTLR